MARSEKTKAETQEVRFPIPREMKRDFKLISAMLDIPQTQLGRMAIEKLVEENKHVLPKNAK